MEGEGVNVQYISSAKMLTRIKQVELVRATVYVHDKIFQIDRFYVVHVEMNRSYVRMFFSYFCSTQKKGFFFFGNFF